MITYVQMDDSYKRLGAMDAPDGRDWKPERIGAKPFVGDLPDKPDRILGDGTYPMDQGDSMRCTAYSQSGAVATVQTRKEQAICTTDPLDQWENQLVYPSTATEKNGDYIQSAIKAAKEYGVQILVNGKWKTVKIKSYARIKSVDIKRYIANGYVVCTGCYWRGMDGAYLKFSGQAYGGHAFFIHSYDNTIEGKPVIARNSWGKWGKIKRGNGDFYIKEENLDQLMSCYIFELNEKESLKDKVLGFFKNFIK